MEKLNFGGDGQHSEEELKAMEEELLQEKCDRMNADVGNLKYYDCNICKNKGYIYVLDNKKIYAKNCVCQKTRKVYESLAESGISEEDLKRYTFENYDESQDYRKIIKTKIYNHFVNFNINDSKNWIMFSGQSGIGKTHILTAEFVSLIRKGYSGKYMLWKQEIEKLNTLKKSFDVKNQKKYDEEIETIKNCDILYIDDFFKQINDYDKSTHLSFAYEIINARYMNKKCTIISTEYDKQTLSSLDSAVFGRIFEMASVWLTPIQKPERNYRLSKIQEF